MFPFHNLLPEQQVKHPSTDDESANVSSRIESTRLAGKRTFFVFMTLSISIFAVLLSIKLEVKATLRYKERRESSCCSTFIYLFLK